MNANKAGHRATAAGRLNPYIANATQADTLSVHDYNMVLQVASGRPSLSTKTTLIRTLTSING